ncbi:MAG TPA: hypothetical protein PLM07_15290 [Candidatus Rifleibacterium sp.]|nr:hypothetical protein [Candidatus Rifleibacterium sp.]HPT47244.1 hypothetical protein [Candidatus Rifleibacterium sp.]
MVNAISTYNLERMARFYGIRIWLCRRTGRRWAFLEGAGTEKVMSSELIFENAEFGVFVQGEDYDKAGLAAEVAQLMQPIGVC